MSIYYDGTNKKRVLSAVEVREGGGGGGGGTLKAHYIRIAPKTVNDTEDVEHQVFFRIISTRGQITGDGSIRFNHLFGSGTFVIYPQDIISVEWLDATTQAAYEENYFESAKRILDIDRSAGITILTPTNYYVYVDGSNGLLSRSINDDYFIWHDTVQEI